MVRYEFEAHRLRVPGAREPLSPIGLIQEMVPSRWGAVIGAIMCIRTTRKQSHRGAWRVLAAWPGPEEMATADLEEVAATIGPAGMSVKRADLMVRMAQGWGVDSLDETRGLGPYVLRSDTLFGTGDVTSPVIDCELFKFASWARWRIRSGVPWRTDWSVDHGEPRRGL